MTGWPRGVLSEALNAAMIFGLLWSAPGGERAAPPAPAEIAVIGPDAVVAPEAVVAPDATTENAPEIARRSAPDALLETALCGDPRLIGRALGALSSETEPRCGATAAVELASAAGVAFAPAAVVNCAMARRLADWVETVLRPAARTHLGAAVAAIAVYDSYSCRPRNHREGAPLSEHGLANAVDLGVFRLETGEEVTVLEGWTAEESPVGGALAAPPLGRAAFLRTLWRESCGRFGTVLGPESDPLHANHLHLDATIRREAYCR